MAEIYIAYDLPSFKDAFKWEAPEAEMAHMLRVYRDQAAAQGIEFSKWIDAVAVQAPQMLAKATLSDGRAIRSALTAWALQLDVQDPEHPGAIIDYIAAYDFWVTITKASGGAIGATVTPQLRSGLGLA